MMLSESGKRASTSHQVLGTFSSVAEELIGLHRLGPSTDREQLGQVVTVDFSEFPDLSVCSDLYDCLML